MTEIYLHFLCAHYALLKFQLYALLARLCTSWEHCGGGLPGKWPPRLGIAVCGECGTSLPAVPAGQVHLEPEDYQAI